MTIHDYRRVFRERWLILLLAVLIGAGAGAAGYFVRPAKYTAKLEMYISTRSVSANESVFAGEGAPDRRVKSYAKLVTSGRVTSAVVRELKLSMSPDELASRLTAATSLDSVVIELFAVDTSPEQAAAIANEAARQLSDVVDDLESVTTPGKVSPVAVQTVQPAAVPTSPTGRALWQWLLLGTLVGIASGVILALVRNAMDNTVKSLAQLRQVSGVPNLGVILADSQVRKRPLIVHDDPQSPRAEAFRQLRTNVQFVDVENEHKILTVASPVAGEGKTTTLVNLAIAIGAAGKRVLIVEADLRRPKAADMLSIDRSVGLTSVIAGRMPVLQAIRTWKSGPIDMLASGPLPPNPSELLAHHRMRSILSELRQRYDVILVDTPPLIPVTDAAAIAPATDGVILLCQFHRTTRPQIDAAVEALGAVGATIVGSVFTMVPGSGRNDGLQNYKGGPLEVESLDAAAPQPVRPSPRPAARVNVPSPSPSPFSSPSTVLDLREEVPTSRDLYRNGRPSVRRAP